MTTKADLLIKKGGFYLAEGMFAQAIASFTLAITADPRRAAAYCRRAEAYHARLQALVGSEPCGAERCEEFRAKLRARKELDLALKDLNAAVGLCPDLAEGRVGLGIIHHEKGQYQEAIAAFTKAIPLQEDKAGTYFRRALAYEAMKDDAHTLEDLDFAILADPGYADAYLEKGVVYSCQERYDEARREIDKAIALDPGKAHYYSQRAMAMSMPAFDSGDEGALCEALIYMDEAIKLDPKNAEAYFDRGLIYGGLGESEMELADFSTTIALDPGHASAYERRFQCFSDLGQKDQAVKDWTQYCARSKDGGRISSPEHFIERHSFN